MYNKLLCIGLLLLAAAADASEKNLKLTIGGDLNTQFGYRSQKQAYAANLNNLEFDKYGIVNDTQTYVKIEAKAHGFKYGGLVNLNADTSPSKVGENTVGHQTMAYIECPVGRLEGGSYTGSYQTLRAGPASLTRAAGGIDGDWKNWIITTVGNGKQITSPRLPTAIGSSYVANASKITYYTGALGGLKAGITYIPDTEQYGTVTRLKRLRMSYADAAISAGAFPANQLSGYTNVFQGGVTYAGKLDKATMKVSALGEIGSAKKFYDPVSLTIVDRRSLRAWEVGANASCKGLGFGASFGDWGRSGLEKKLYTRSRHKSG